MNIDNYTLSADSGNSIENNSCFAHEGDFFGPYDPYKYSVGHENYDYYQEAPFGLLRKLRSTPEIVTYGGRSMKNRTRSCMKFVAGGYASIRESKRNGEGTGRHFWSSLMTCKSVHLCPICSIRRRSFKAAEVQHCINGWLRDGGAVSLVTLTFPHRREDSLIDLTDRMLEANRSFIGHRTVREIWDCIGFFEAIRNIEFTWGTDNGFHPHTHQLWFTESEIDPDELKGSLFPQWEAACIRRGLRAPDYEHGMDIRCGESAAEYLAKTGIGPDKDLAKEITHSHCKLARGERLTPMGITARLGDDPLYMRLWCEYAVATHRRHVISRFPKLKNRYGTPDLNEDDLNVSILKTLVSPEDYSLIYSKDLLWEALKVFNDGGSPADFGLFLRSLHDEQAI